MGKALTKEKINEPLFAMRAEEDTKELTPAEVDGLMAGVDARNLKLAAELTDKGLKMEKLKGKSKKLLEGLNSLDKNIERQSYHIANQNKILFEMILQKQKIDKKITRINKKLYKLQKDKKQ